MARRKKRGPGEGSIFRRKDGRWVAELFLGYGPNGKKKVARAYAKSHAEAKTKLLDLMRKRTDSLLASEADQQTVREFLERWLEDVAAMTLRPSSLRTYRNVVRHIVSVIGDVELRELTPQHLQRLYRIKRDEGLARTATMIHAVLHKALSHAVRWGILSKNVADMVDRPKPPQKEQRALDVSEVQRFFEAARKDRLYALYVLAATCGLRIGEALGLKWEDVNFDQRTLTVQRQLQWLKGQPQLVAPKSEKSKRTIVLPQVALGALREHRVRQAEERLRAGAAWQDHGLIFTTSIGTPLSPANVRNRSFYRILKEAGLPRIRFHDLRHTTATLLLARGVHPRLVQELLGHSQISLTLDTYTHVMAPMLRQVADEMDALLGPQAAAQRPGSDHTGKPLTGMLTGMGVITSDIQ